MVYKFKYIFCIRKILKNIDISTFFRILHDEATTGFETLAV